MDQEPVEAAPAYARPPSTISRAVSGVIRLGTRPFVHLIPGHAGSIRTARSTVDAASLLLRPSPRVRIRQVIDPRVETGRVQRSVRGEWVLTRDAGRAAPAGAVLYLHGGAYVF